ncbi:MAG: hypothetical protein KME50_38575 [Nostoc desertorum CM1-VF14]|jgi:hypothetical protein|nr:hypothetical protein [Nostoc desertorum CM1-VF14]
MVVKIWLNINTPSPQGAIVGCGGRLLIGQGEGGGRPEALLKPSPKGTKTGSGDRRCNDRNSSTSPQSRLPAVATWSGEGLLGSRGISGGTLWQARAFMFSVGSGWR